jgi:hypothetical protein
LQATVFVLQLFIPLNPFGVTEGPAPTGLFVFGGGTRNPALGGGVGRSKNLVEYLSAKLLKNGFGGLPTRQCAGMFDKLLVLSTKKPAG